MSSVKGLLALHWSSWCGDEAGIRGPFNLPSIGNWASFLVSHQHCTQLGAPTPADDPTMGRRRLFLAADLLPLWYLHGPELNIPGTFRVIMQHIFHCLQYAISNTWLATTRSMRWFVTLGCCPMQVLNLFDTQRSGLLGFPFA